MKTVHHSVRLAGRPQRLEVDFIRTLMLNWISINKLGLGLTIFAWSDAAATHRARNFVRLLAAFIKLSVIGKIFRNCKGFEKSQFYKITKNCDAVTWFWSKPSSLISRRFATKRTYAAPPISFLVFFQWFHTMIALRAWKKLLWTACVLVSIECTHLILPFETRGFFTCACATR